MIEVVVEDDLTRRKYNAEQIAGCEVNGIWMVMGWCASGERGLVTGGWRWVLLGW